MLTGTSSPQSGFGIQNRRFERVHARTATLTASFGGPKGHKKESVTKGNRSDAFFRLVAIPEPRTYN